MKTISLSRQNLAAVWIRIVWSDALTVFSRQFAAAVGSILVLSGCNTEGDNGPRTLSPAELPYAQAALVVAKATYFSLVRVPDWVSVDVVRTQGPGDCFYDNFNQKPACNYLNSVGDGCDRYGAASDYSEASDDGTTYLYVRNATDCGTGVAPVAPTYQTYADKTMQEVETGGSYHYRNVASNGSHIVTIRRYGATASSSGFVSGYLTRRGIDNETGATMMVKEYAGEVQILKGGVQDGVNVTRLDLNSMNFRYSLPWYHDSGSRASMKMDGTKLAWIRNNNAYHVSLQDGFTLQADSFGGDDECLRPGLRYSFQERRPTIALLGTDEHKFTDGAYIVSVRDPSLSDGTQQQYTVEFMPDGDNIRVSRTGEGGIVTAYTFDNYYFFRYQSLCHPEYGIFGLG